MIVPVKDAGPLLGEVLAAVRDQGEVELIVVDSGSRDGSPEIARAAGAELIEIPPDQFGHGRTRNLAAERSSGELICFLTQDAVPEPGWLDAYRESFELDPRVGAAFGPHLPVRATRSPMVARELTEFFAGFSPNGTPALHRAGDLTFLSNVNACYLRECWEELRFAGHPVQRGPGVRARDARGGLGEGVPAARRGPARARLRPARLHAALLRRVQGPAGGQRPRGTAAAARRRSRGCGRRALDARAGTPGARPGALDSALDRSPRRPARGVGARLTSRGAAGPSSARSVPGRARRRGPRRRPCPPASRCSLAGAASRTSSGSAAREPPHSPPPFPGCLSARCTSRS